MPPLPNPNRRRRNKPIIPTTALPAAGRDGPAPECPYELGESGRAWWDWAWATPQAAGWSEGDIYAVARRAAMEDPKTVIVGKGDDRMAVEVEGGTANEKLQLDDRLGLTAKGMAALHWTIIEAPESDTAVAPDDPKVTSIKAKRDQLRAS